MTVTAGEQIPGISARELEVMLGAAGAFLSGRETGPAQIACVGGMRALLAAAPAEAAGKVSAGPDEYFRGTGRLVMFMAEYAQ